MADEQSAGNDRWRPSEPVVVLISLILVAAVANLNLSVANVALPVIGAHFDVGPNDRST